jgi:hypothetical protein
MNKEQTLAAKSPLIDRRSTLHLDLRPPSINDGHRLAQQRAPSGLKNQPDRNIRQKATEYLTGTSDPEKHRIL